MATVRRRLTREQAERRARVVELRRSPRYGVDELRAEETELIDRAVNSLMGIATDSNPHSWQ